jgi:hypothetical protein
MLGTLASKMGLDHLLGALASKIGLDQLLNSTTIALVLPYLIIAFGPFSSSVLVAGLLGHYPLFVG